MNKLKFLVTSRVFHGGVLEFALLSNEWLIETSVQIEDMDTAYLAII